MKTKRNLQRKKGFTIAEITVTIAVFALVATMAIGFVTTMSKFTEQNSKDVDRLQNQLTFRMEMDKWFSAMDSYNAEFCIDRDNLQPGQLVVATINSEQYWVSFATQESGGEQKVNYNVITFTYPPEFGVENDSVTVTTNNVEKVVLTKFEADVSEGERPSNSTLFRFEIALHVTHGSMCCEVYYNKNQK